MGNLTVIQVNDTFKQKFVASGTDPSVITASIIDGNETIVSSGAGVNSLNGHFYRNVPSGVSTPGYYVSEWNVVIGGLSYKRRFQFEAVLNEVD